MSDLDDAVEDDAPAPARSVPVSVVALVVVAVVGLLVVVLFTREPATDREVDSPLVGQAAPSLAGTTLDGDEIVLDELRGRWVLVNFFATWCAPCVQEHDDLAAFHDRHTAIGDAGVLSVVFDDTTENAREFFADDHKHLMLLVSEGRLLGTVLRSDLATAGADDRPAQSRRREREA